ncbi:MAG: hypothetical protein ACW98K_00065 [Candidatus Kariarchaeaceae archaeon]|jgi:hypothetical protein
MNKINTLKEKIQEHKANRDYFEFKRKRSLYQDHFFDSEIHEIHRDEEQEIIDNLRKELEQLEDNNRRNGSYYIKCAHCEQIVHQRRIRTHKCITSSATQFNKRLTA